MTDKAFLKTLKVIPEIAKGDINWKAPALVVVADIALAVMNSGASAKREQAIYKQVKSMPHELAEIVALSINEACFIKKIASVSISATKALDQLDDAEVCPECGKKHAVMVELIPVRRRRRKHDDSGEDSFSA